MFYNPSLGKGIVIMDYPAVSENFGDFYYDLVACEISIPGLKKQIDEIENDLWLTFVANEIFDFNTDSSDPDICTMEELYFLIFHIRWTCDMSCATLIKNYGYIPWKDKTIMRKMCRIFYDASGKTRKVFLPGFSDYLIDNIKRFEPIHSKEILKLINKNKFQEKDYWDFNMLYLLLLELRY